MNRSDLLTGFGKVDFTPDFSVGLSGYGGDFNRLHTDVVAPVYITCVAAKQDETTVLLYTVDTCGLRIEHIRRFRKAVTAAVGVPDTHIFFGAIHGHNCPTMISDEEPSAVKTIEFMEQAAVKAAQLALEDLDETTVLAAKPEFPGMNFTRHYRQVGGIRTTLNSGFRRDIPMAGHMGPNDPHMVLIKFARQSKKDIVLVNWQAHPDDARQIGFTSIAPGFVGPLRDRLEKLSGCQVAYFTGASGNQARDSFISKLAHGLPWNTYGDLMARKAFAAFGQLQPVEGSGIQVARTLLPVKINHSWDHKSAQADEIMEARAAGDKDKEMQLQKAYGFTTPAHVTGVWMRSRMEENGELELNALRIGGVAFACNTCETFSDQGIFIKNYSPYEYTMIVTGNRSYLAAQQAFDYFAYEAVGGSAYYERGTAEKMADALVGLLTELQ